MEKKEHKGEVGLPIRLNLRVSESEYAAIEGRAKAVGCTVSQAARHLMFRREADDPDLPEGERRIRILAAVKSVRDEFRRHAAAYRGFAESYRRSTLITNSAGEPAVSTAQTLRIVKSLSAVTAELQDDVNRMARAVGVPEVHDIRGDGDGAPDRRCEVMRIRGVLAEGPSPYKSSGADRLLLKVRCSRPRGNGRAEVLYSVFAVRDSVAARLRAGQEVCAEGAFDETDSGEKVIVADSVYAVEKEADTW